MDILSYKVGVKAWFFFGEAEFFLAKLDTAHEKGHVVSKRAHGL